MFSFPALKWTFLLVIFTELWSHKCKIFNQIYELDITLKNRDRNTMWTHTDLCNMFNNGQEYKVTELKASNHSSQWSQ